MADAQQPNAPMNGRKIFFLNPSFSMRTHIIAALRKLEYEVYTFTDYKKAKAYLTIYHDSILYINTETQLDIQAWMNFVRAIKEDMAFNSTLLGIFCDHMGPTEANLVASSKYIDAGIFHAEGAYAGMLHLLTQKLEQLSAKGRRQYVRANCTNDPTAGFLWIQNGKMFKAKLIDISVASVAILVATHNVPFLNATAQTFCTLQLNNKQVQTRAKLLIVKQKTPNTSAAIFMLDENTPAASLDLIRAYIFETLDNEILQSVKGMALDRASY